MLTISQAFRRVSWRLSQRPGLLAIYILSALALVTAVGAFAALAQQLRSPVLAVGHIAAAPGCSAAEQAGLRHAQRGDAGYYASQDVDGDGIACNSLSDRFGSNDLALRHLAAEPSCAAARTQNLAPSYRGMPGYYPAHDADGDGIACEPYFRR
ncbi:MAG: excalibur calcium-binding domain-containing protein [Hyphomonadaceae bacterium]|nr:excalibur calcium-binding domain-containing protein [Hyphomonadaceae bacterium]